MRVFKSDAREGWSEGMLTGLVTPCIVTAL
jgi:hypothetical protein